MVCLPEWLAGTLLLAAVFRGGLRDWFEHSPRFQSSTSTAQQQDARKSQDGDGSR